MLKSLVLSRLREASTWRGVMLLLTALGVRLEPEQTEAVITVGLSLTGLLAVFLPDRLGKKPSDAPVVNHGAIY